MNYELALKLEIAGFPNIQLEVWSENDDGSRSLWTPPVYPNLDELIEACNPLQFDEFGLMVGYTDQWEAFANYHGHAIKEVDIKVKGATPSEALSNLWLALQDRQ